MKISQAEHDIKCVKETIIVKEAKGMPTHFERDLLKHWAKVKGYESAKEVLAELPEMPPQPTG